MSELVDRHGHHADHPGCSAAVCQHYCRCAVLQRSAEDDERGTTGGRDVIFGVFFGRIYLAILGQTLSVGQRQITVYYLLLVICWIAESLLP